MITPVKLACLLAPNLPIQVERAKQIDSVSFLIPHPVDGATVFAASDDLLHAGVEIGMSVYQARQIAPMARIVEPDEATYHARHGALHESLKTYSLAIETVALGEFLLDIRGLERVHGSDESLAAALLESARAASGLSVQVGISAGKFTAQQAARSASENGVCVVPTGEESRFLSPLPITVLPNLPNEMRRRLTLLDIHTLGDLTALRKPAVLRQFGAEASGLYELARGHDPRPLQPDAPPLRFTRSMTPIEPIVDRRIILNMVTHLARRLSRALTTRGYHAEAIKLTLEVTSRTRGPGDIRLEVGQAVKPPTADEARLTRLAMQLLGRLGAAAPVARISLSAYPLRSWHLGTHQLALVKAGVPERLTRLEDVLHLILHRFGQAAIQIAALLGPPLPIKTQVSLNTNGLPARLKFGDQVREIVGIDEHWREEKSWWDLRPIRRDYFRVALADGSLRNIFQDLIDGGWYIDRAWPIL